MNEDKIVKEKVYDLDNVYETLDTAFAQFNLPKISKGIYTNGNSKYDYAHLWSVIWDLTEEKWFMDNVSDFIWYNSDIGENEADFSVEDILEYCQSHKIGTCV